MTVKERIKIFVDSKKMTVSAFEKSIDASNGYVNSISKSIGIDKLVLILEHYPNLNIEWLLTGKGEMLKETGTCIANDISRKVEEPPTPVKRDEEFLEMQRELIRSQKDQISCYKELINELKKEHTDYVPGLDVSQQELKK